MPAAPHIHRLARTVAASLAVGVIAAPAAPLAETPPAVRSIDESFDRGAAGIGAGGAAGMALLGPGGMSFRRRPDSRPRPNA